MFGRNKPSEPLSEPERKALELLGSGGLGWSSMIVVCSAGLDPKDCQPALDRLVAAGLADRQVLYGEEKYMISGAGRRYLR